MFFWRDEEKLIPKPSSIYHTIPVLIRRENRMKWEWKTGPVWKSREKKTISITNTGKVNSCKENCNKTAVGIDIAAEFYFSLKTFFVEFSP